MTQKTDTATEALLCDQYIAGVPAAQLIDKYEVGTTTFYRILRRNGVNRRGSDKTTPTQRKEIIRRYRKGETCAGIAPDYGMSEPGILRILKREGVDRRYSHSVSPLTAKQEQTIVTRYLAGESSGDIAPDFGIVDVTVLRVLERNGVDRRDTSEANRRYPIQNEDFFDAIDTEEKAYFLGLLYADGFNNTDIGYVELSLAEGDKEIVEKFRDIFQPTRPLQFVEKKNPKHQNVVRYSVSSRRLSDQLATLGCMKAKTFKIKFPSWLRKDLVRHFIRGYVDGDGHLGLYTSTRATVPQVGFSLVGTLALCLSIREQLKYQCRSTVPISITARHPERNHNIRTLRVRRKHDVIRVIGWLYDNSHIYMNRKHTKYLEIVGGKKK